MTQRVALAGASLFNVYDRDYADTDAFCVGETVPCHIDPLADVSSEPDRIELQVRTASGQERTVELVETSHSGVFQSLAPFSHEADPSGGDRLNAVPVAYGDEVTFYKMVTTASSGWHHRTRCRCCRDPFTKRFRDPDIAMGNDVLNC